MSLKCYYHPEREATTKCEKCEKMLCIECKKPYTVTHGVSESRYATQHDMCKPCYYDIEMQRYTISSRGYYIAFSILVPIILTLVILYIVFLSRVGFMAFAFLAGGSVPMFLFVCLLLNFILSKKRAPAKLAELKAKKEEFFKTLQSGNVCPECGSKVETGISVCPSCGYNITG